MEFEEETCPNVGLRVRPMGVICILEVEGESDENPSFWRGKNLLNGIRGPD